MASNGTKPTGRSGLSNIDGVQLAIQVIVRFFYQILGIYLPAIILLLYFLLFWSEPLDTFVLHSQFYSFIKDAHYVDPQIILSLSLVLFIILIGEAINVVTSNVTTISPVKLTFKEKLAFILVGSPHSIWPQHTEIKEPKWPVWLNYTSYPVRFAIFDRYYLSVVEADKKVLAGKIGWVAFYRNMVAILIIISTSILLEIIFQKGLLPAGTLNNFRTYLFPEPTTFAGLVGTLVLVLVFVYVFYRGYKAQTEANNNIFWNAYRRNELSKNLSTQEGEFVIGLGIKDEYKKLAEQFILDKWFTAVQLAVASVSSSILSTAEKTFASMYGNERSEFKVQSREGKNRFGINWAGDSNFEKRFSHDGIPVFRSKDKEEIKKRLIETAAQWHEGNYEMVISQALSILEQLQNLPTTYHWKLLRGYFVFENGFHTRAATEEIKKNVSTWGWIYSNQKDAGNGVRSSNLQYGSNQNMLIGGSTQLRPSNGSKLTPQEIISQSLDPWTEAYFKIQRASEQLSKWIEEYQKSQKDFLAKEKECFNLLRTIYCLFGGYEYERAGRLADILFEELNKPDLQIDFKKTIVVLCEKCGNELPRDDNSHYCGNISNTTSGAFRHQSFEHREKLGHGKKWYHCKGYLYEK
jgi:hypothetical protein